MSRFVNTGERPRRNDDRPRRVTGGLKLGVKAWPGDLGWAGRRWLAIAEREAPADAMREGLEYARKGQTRRLAFERGRLTASVQGASPRPIEVVIDLPRLSEAEWARALDALADRATHTAQILAGRVGPDIEDAFASRGLSITPESIGASRISTTPAKHGGAWTTPVCCAWIIASERIDRSPADLFELRGLPMDELLPELRARRSAPSGPGEDPIPDAVSQHPGVDRCRAPLESAGRRFWTAGPELERVRTPIRPPRVSHPMLRRLGASPFQGGKFPLAGLLATCYDLISDAALAFDAEREGASRAEGEADAGGGCSEAGDTYTDAAPSSGSRP